MWVIVRGSVVYGVFDTKAQAKGYAVGRFGGNEGVVKDHDHLNWKVQSLGAWIALRDYDFVMAV